MPHRYCTFALALSIFTAICGSGCTTATSDPTGAVQALSSSPAAADSASGASLSVGPDSLAQLMLERINRARLRPADEAARYRIAIDEGIPGQLNDDPKQPVSFNGVLAVAARKHADDMLANDYFAHNDLSGASPFDRMRAAGYIFSAAGENLAWRGNTLTIDPVETVEQMHEDLFVDSSIADRGHRKVMLNDAFREVGVSVRRGPFTENGTRYDSLMAVQDYGTARGSKSFFVMGVVYDDKNGNGDYDAGEGSANQLVTLADQTVTTGDGGGYTFEAAPGEYTVRFANGAAQKVVLLTKNVKIDLVSNKQVVVNLGLGQF